MLGQGRRLVGANAQHALRQHSSKNTPAAVTKAAPKQSGGGGVMAPLVVTALTAGGFVAALKTSPEFRSQVEKNAPMVTDTLKQYVDLEAPVSFELPKMPEIKMPEIKMPEMPKIPDLKIPDPTKKSKPEPAPPAPKAVDPVVEAPAPVAEEPAPAVEDPAPTIEEAVSVVEPEPAQPPAPVAVEETATQVPAVYVKSIEDDIQEINQKSKTLWLHSVEGAMSEVFAQSKALQVFIFCLSLQEKNIKFTRTLLPQPYSIATIIKHNTSASLPRPSLRASSAWMLTP
jgi:hypothetical protein